MKAFFSAAPSAVWIAVIALLGLLATWASTYFGDVAWVAPVAGLIITVVVPVLKIIAQGEQPPATTARAIGEPAPEPRSKFSRWLL